MKTETLIQGWGREKERGRGWEILTIKSKVGKKRPLKKKKKASIGPKIEVTGQHRRVSPSWLFFKHY